MAEVSGTANVWGLYETDDLNSTTIASVYDAADNLLGIAVGRDIAAECPPAKPTRHCVYRKVSGEELILEKVTDTGTTKLGKISDQSFLYNIGLHARASEGRLDGKINGNFTHSFLGNRSLYGHDPYRFRFTELYGQFTTDRLRFTMGRQALPGGFLVDGAAVRYLFGPASSKDTQSIGVFSGLGPHPITLDPKLKFITFGATTHYIPKFAANSDVKLRIDATLFGQLYRSKMNRLTLFIKAHFTPIRSLSFLALTHLELPWTGSRNNIRSSHSSFQTFWRPHSAWFLTGGFSQFQISRFMEEQAVRWTLDNNHQAQRVGETLDRSQRYRLDFRVSYRLLPQAQPFVRIRYERRTFDFNKIFDNSSTPLTNTGLLNRKNAYQGTLGLRLSLFDYLETETRAQYFQRFQSKGYHLSQTAEWNYPKDWTFEASVDFVSSNRKIQNSISSNADLKINTTDYYFGAGVSYRLLTNFLSSLHYDFSSEEDAGLGVRITIHTVFARLQYTF